MKTIIKLLKKSKKIALFSHISPDPDTIGSTMALCCALRSIGKEVWCFCDDVKTEEFKVFDSLENFNKFELIGENNEILDNDFDLFVAVDISTAERAGKFKPIFDNKENTIRIDHHKMSDDFAKFNYMVPDSACALVVYDFITKMKIKITPKIATYLYFAICGDTGIFHFNNTDSKTFLICSKLLEKGADIRYVYSEYFDKKTVPELKLASYSLLNAKINDELKYVIMKVCADDYDKFNAPETAYIGNLPNSYLNCGYKVACILKEKQDGIRISLRSKFEYDCSIIAQTMGGGGHKNASGISVQMPIDEAEKQIEKSIVDYLINFENKN